MTIEITSTLIADTRADLLEALCEVLYSWIVDEFDSDPHPMASYVRGGGGVQAIARALDRKHGRLAPTDGQQQLDVSVAMPAHSRYGDPSESAIAAESVDRAKSTLVKHLVKTTVSLYWPITDEQIFERVQAALANDNQRTTPQRVRTLRKELLDEDEIEEHTEKGRTVAGRPCRQWRLPQ